MTDPTPEQIGPLVFLPNPDYPYPFDVPVPPYFWMEEQTGTLGPIINSYINGEELDPAQITLIRQYLRQYVERAVLPGGANRKLLLARGDKIRTTRDVERFADELAEWAVEPF